ERVDDGVPRGAQRETRDQEAKRREERAEPTRGSLPPDVNPRADPGKDESAVPGRHLGRIQQNRAPRDGPRGHRRRGDAGRAKPKGDVGARRVASPQTEASSQRGLHAEAWYSVCGNSEAFFAQRRGAQPGSRRNWELEPTLAASAPVETTVWGRPPRWITRSGVRELGSIPRGEGRHVRHLVTRSGPCADAASGDP